MQATLPTGVSCLALAGLLSAGASSAANYSPVADAHVRADTPTLNVGTATTLIVKGTASERRTFLRFNVGGLGASSVSSALLKVYVTALPDGGTPALRALSVADDTWSETAVSWNNQPPTVAEIDRRNVTAAAAWTSLDVTARVNSQLANGDTLLSLALFGDAVQALAVQFNSREATTNRPVLELMTSVATPTFTPTATPTATRTPTPSPTAPATLKEAAKGLYMTRGNSLPEMSFIDHRVVAVNWAQIEPSDQNFDFSAIDSVLNNTTLKIRIRPFSGRDAPNWVKKLGGPARGTLCTTEGGIEVWRDTPNAGIIKDCVPYFWTDVYLNEYAELMTELARRYDSHNRVLDVVNSACMTIWAEPFYRSNFSDSNKRLWDAGLNETTDTHCFERSMQIHDQAFARTRRSLATAGSWEIVTNTNTSYVEKSWPKEGNLLDRLRVLYGRKMVIQNNGMGGDEGCDGAGGRTDRPHFCWMKNEALADSSPAIRAKVATPPSPSWTPSWRCAAASWSGSTSAATPLSCNRRTRT